MFRFDRKFEGPLLAEPEWDEVEEAEEGGAGAWGKLGIEGVTVGVVREFAVVGVVADSVAAPAAALCEVTDKAEGVDEAVDLAASRSR